MKEIIRILMDHNGISEEEARVLVKETRDEIMMLDDPYKADEVIMDYLNLEPGYIYEIVMLYDPCKADKVIMNYFNNDPDYIYEILDI